MTLGWYVLLGNKSMGSVDESPAKHAQGRAVTAKGRPDFIKRETEARERNCGMLSNSWQAPRK